MIAKLQSVLHDLLVALGLLDRPTLQPVPVRDDKGGRQPPRRR
ncbi:PA1414 family protein [Pseudomonas sp. XK-1]|jgi:hypothetical protein|nr:PA1414 family protein [Pseudomonas sp.]